MRQSTELSHNFILFQREDGLGYVRLASGSHFVAASPGEFKKLDCCGRRLQVFLRIQRSWLDSGFRLTRQSTELAGVRAVST